MIINIRPELASFKNLRTTLYLILVTLSLGQFIISGFSVPFFFIIISIFILSTLNIYLLIRPKLLRRYIFPIILTFSFNFGALSGPLLFKTLFFQPLFSNLINPINTFQYLIISNLLIIIALLIFINSQLLKSISSIISNILIILKNFKEPNTKFLNLLFTTYLIFWIIIYIYDQGPNSFSSYGSVIIKFMEGTKMLFFVPIVYYIKFYLIDRKVRSIHFYVLVIFYTIFLAFISLSINGRTVFIQFFIIITFLLILFIFFQKQKIIIVDSKFLIGLILISILFLNLINEIILSSRSDRITRTSSEQLKYSIELYKNDKFHSIDKLFYNDEAYTRDLSIDRLIFPKYFDLFYFQATDKKRQMFIEYYNKKFITILPLPLINLLGINIKKADYTNTSKSFLENIKGGGKHSLGSIVAEFIYISGNFFVLFWLLFVLIIFTFFHAFQKKNYKKIILSPIAIIFIWWIYHFFFTDSIHQSISIIRQILQNSFFYFVFYQISRFTIRT